MEKTMIINSIAHLLVDGVCAATLFGKLRNDPSVSDLVMLYTTLAFSTQGFVGLLADRIKQHAISGAVAMLAVAAGYFFPLPSLLRVISIGIGNSVFHVAGGSMTLEGSEGKAGKLGVFVAPGAIGLILGTKWPVVGTAFAVSLLVFAVLMFYNPRGTTPRTAAAPEKPEVAAIVLLTLAVAVRAIGGTAVSFPWNTTSCVAMLLAAFVFSGKLVGGYLCDRVGAGKTAWVSIPFAAVLITFCSQWMIPSLIGQLLLNLTMPVTLWLLYRSMPDSPGFAFGLAASALWPGTLIGRMMNGKLLWFYVLISFSFGLIAILHSEKRILNGVRRI